jgi:hypothetical protein
MYFPTLASHWHVGSTNTPPSRRQKDLPMPAQPAVPVPPARPAITGPGRRRPGQLTAVQLDRYARQLARCLKALGTDAPIRAEVQQELTDVRTEQHARATAGPPPATTDRTAGR